MFRAQLFSLMTLVLLAGAQSRGLARGDDARQEQSSKAGEESDAQRRTRLRLERNQRILNREELEAAMAPHLDAIKGCYQTHGAKQKEARGEVQLGMLIHPKGSIQNLWIRTPGVKGTALDRCIRDLSPTWRFPEKAGFTNAVIPLYFQKTNAVGAGPFESCWSANGCPKKPDPKNSDSKKLQTPKRRAK